MKISEHLRNNLVGYVAVFLSLTMGTAYATHPGGANTISTVDIINGEVRSADVNDGALRTEDLGDGTVTSAKIGNAQVKEADIGDGEVHSIDITNGAVHGIDVTNDDLKGADIDESSLNGVNADQLDGQDSSAFAQGRTYYNAVALGGSGLEENVASVPNRFHVSYNCPETPQTDGEVAFVNAGSGTMNLFLDDGGANPTYTQLLPDTVTRHGSSFGGERLVYSYQASPVGGSTYGTVVVEAVDRVNDCHVQVQAFLNR